MSETNRDQRELPKQGGPNGLAEVRPVDSTLRSGEPITWGSGRQESNRSWETWAPFKGRIRPSMQREDDPVMATGLERIAARSFSLVRPRLALPYGKLQAIAML